MGYWTCKFIILLAFYYASLAIEGNTYNCVDKFLRGQLLCNIVLQVGVNTCFAKCTMFSGLTFTFMTDY